MRYCISLCRFALACRLEFCHALSQHPQGTIQLHVLVNTLDFARCDTATRHRAIDASAVAAMDSALDYVLLDYVERVPEVLFGELHT